MRNVSRLLRPAEHVLHVTYHAFLAAPAAAVARALAFLGVDPKLREAGAPLAYRRPSEEPICRKVRSRKIRETTVLE